MSVEPGVGVDDVECSEEGDRLGAVLGIETGGRVSDTVFAVGLKVMSFPRSSAPVGNPFAMVFRRECSSAAGSALSSLVVTPDSWKGCEPFLL